MLGHAIAAGALFYGETRRRVDVAFDAALRDLTLETITATRSMLQDGRTPTAQPRLLGRGSHVQDWLLEQLKEK